MLTDRLEIFINSLGLTIHAFEVGLNVGNGTIRKPLKAEKSIGSEILEKIFALYPDLDPSWLMTGRGDMLLSSKNKLQVAEEISPLQTAITRFPKILSNRTVPILDAKAAAGDPFIFDHPDYYRKLETFTLPASMFPPGNYAGIQVRGDSMADTLHAGDFVFGREIENLTQLKAGDIYIVVYQEDSRPHFVVKRCYYYLGDDEINLRSDNPNDKLKDFLLPVSSLMRLYHVVGRFTTTIGRNGTSMVNKVEILEGRLKNIEDRID